MTTAQYDEIDDPDDPDSTDGSGCSIDGSGTGAGGTCQFGHTAADQAAADAHNDAETARYLATCPATLDSGPASDPGSTGCDLPREHVTATFTDDGSPDLGARKHEGDDPFGGGGRIRWSGGGYCAGDPLPVSGVEFIHPATPAPAVQLYVIVTAGDEHDQVTDPMTSAQADTWKQDWEAAHNAAWNESGLAVWGAL